MGCQFVLQKEININNISIHPTNNHPQFQKHTQEELIQTQAVLTETVVSVVGQHESIIAGAPVIARYVDAFMDTAPIVVVLTLVHV